MSTHPALLTKSEAAKELRVCVRTVEKYISDRRLASLKMGKVVRVEREALDALKDSFRREALV